MSALSNLEKKEEERKAREVAERRRLEEESSARESWNGVGSRRKGVPGDQVKGGEATTAGVGVAEALDLNLVVRDPVAAAMADGAVARGDQVGVE